MSARVRPAVLAAAVAVVALAAPGPARAGGLAFHACREAAGAECATLAVPLDRAGRLPGSIALSVQRHLAGARPTSSALLPLAGGPGQATLPFFSYFVRSLEPALATRDLIAFDQRGTGASDPLTCAALDSPLLPSQHPLERCALDIGPARGDFTSADSVQDIEALRAAAGYQRLTLYATSYGTKVALNYAAAYPQHVEALVLDSVVQPAGIEPFSVGSFQAMTPVLDELCEADACRGITNDPAGDLARLNARLRVHRLRGSVFDGSGRRRHVSLGESSLFGILVAGDLNPALRALLPAAVHSALAGDSSPLLQLELLAAGLIPSTPGGGTGETGGEDEALFATTFCEETPFPWQRSADPATRIAEALAALHAHPASDFYPFDAQTGLGSQPTLECAHWPDASPPPPPEAPLPDVPTLILSGAADLRTPTAGAREVAARIPGAQLLVVPFTGHSVLGSDLSGCAARALAQFFAGSAVSPCGPTTDIFSPTPVSPTRFSALHPPPGLAGRPGRTLVAVLDTLLDLDRLIVGATLEAAQELPSGSAFGGLRGGRARLARRGIELHDYSFVPGVTVTGVIPIAEGQLRPGTLRVGGRAAAGGEVRVGSPLKHVSGRLGGRRFSLSVSRAHLSAAGQRAPAPWPLGARLGAVAARLRASRH
jgi:pimeloyl-ACP methyl ester carboxylesterase